MLEGGLVAQLAEECLVVEVAHPQRAHLVRVRVRVRVRVS